MPALPIRSVNDFLLSTYFADGLRITFGVLCPPLILAQFGLLEIGMTLSLGALVVSVADSPGPIVHRRNAMGITILLITIFSILTGITNTNVYFIGLLLAVSCFIFSMFFVYGARAASVGIAVLLIIVLSIDDIRPWRTVLTSSSLLFAGGTWYALLSYMVYRIRPYRMVQQSLSDSIYEVSEFLRVKSRFYKEGVDYKATYDELLRLQVSVHEKQEVVREVLFKTREIVRDSTPEGRFLLLVFVDMVDLFEQVMSTYYNYRKLHEQFDPTGILRSYESVLLKAASALDEVAYSLKTGGLPDINDNLIEEIAVLKQEIALLEQDNAEGSVSTLGIIALKNIEVNIENILGRIKTINSYFNKEDKKFLKTRKIDVKKFTTRQSFDKKLFVENLTFKSAAFRHSVRVVIVMLIGFIVSRLLDFSHSYWILLTILVISKPGFSLTKERNYQRILGTVIGAFIGMGILWYVKDKNVLFVILIICMIGNYSFQRKNYVVSVLFMTPYTLVVFDFLGMGSMALASERIYDTLIGGAIAFVSSYFLFPNWESENIKNGMLAIVKANKSYFEQIMAFYFNEDPSLTKYKVARKDVYVSTANLASLFQRMLSEPKSKQLFIKELHQFTALNHLLSSYIATLSLYYKDHAYKFEEPEVLQPVANNTIYLMELSLEKIAENTGTINNVPLIKRVSNRPSATLDEAEQSIMEQFYLVQKVTYDIYKLSETIRL